MLLCTRIPGRKIADDQHGHIRYNCDVRTVNIRDLKAQLSAQYSARPRWRRGARVRPQQARGAYRSLDLEGRSEQEQRLIPVAF